ncbi:MAG: hypothetical protein ABGY42_12180 [bacterium]
MRRALHVAATALVLTCLILTGGCATIISKGEMRQVGQTFSGVQLDAGVASCLWQAAFSADTQPRGLGNIAYFFIGLGPLGDMPVSLVADLLFFPVDMAVGSDQQETTVLSTPAVLGVCGSGQLPAARKAHLAPMRLAETP